MAIFFCKLQIFTLLLIQGYSVSAIVCTIWVKKKKDCFRALSLIRLDLLLQMHNRQLWGHSPWAWELEGCTVSDTSSFRSFKAYSWVRVPFLALLSLKAGAGGAAALSLEIVWTSQGLLQLTHPLAHTCPFPKAAVLILPGKLGSHWPSPRAVLSFVTEVSPGLCPEMSCLVIKWSLDQLWPCVLWWGTFSSCYWRLILSLNAF